ncbi:nitroreductase family deazaflavin-dependent oxidoreductase [Catenulispora sp. NF23]|uniref:Nitroreductase family deazaflavin-dependent oxidoreductase n=1 Tax=Catenulispora pinistramenti TaxID=2705254 RepID=A0ABS5KSP5_9ACTN|nr:nitroreductase/quinone reductase family protein [Catenulispora pinistramenti]MBS2532413.1 nitroreductase family deazaflavin-dependent oxidoreductase [Catenulispora pinistramenti]MBS2549072.1 nitroreductase family deazaflavin-dependent oxidoreductase [Catenulispora pinistramenti]
MSMLDATMRSILRSPLHGMVSKKMLIVTVTGRKSGRVYANPVGYVESGGDLLIGTAAKWRRNLVPGEPVPITWRGRDTVADWEVITDEEEIAEPYRVVIAGNPSHRKRSGVSLDADGNVDRDQLRGALARGAAVVRLRPVPTA